MSVQLYRHLPKIGFFLSKGSIFHQTCQIRCLCQMHSQLFHPFLIPDSIIESNRVLVRNYAKGKDKKKSDKGKGQKIEINEAAIAEVIQIDKLKKDMESSLQRMKEEYIKNLSLRTNTGSVEQLRIKFEGKTYILLEVAQIIRQNPKSIIVNMQTFPQLIPSAVKALSTSGMNLNPQQDGTTIYIPVPKVTREYRENLAKNAKALFIKCKDNIRDIQHKVIRSIKSKEKSGLAEDIGYSVSQQVIAIADQYIAQAEKAMEAKQAELLQEFA